MMPKHKLEKLKATAAKLQQQIEALEKLKQWEPRGGPYDVSRNGVTAKGLGVSIASYAEFGTERQTAEAAEKASDVMRTHNRLLAYVDEFGDNWEADWTCIKSSSSYRQSKYFISFDLELEEYYVKSMGSYRVLSAVYMSKDCAQGLAAKLNSGEVVL